MKSWRERIAEAEDRQTRVSVTFVQDDMSAIRNPDICMLGEAAEAIGLSYMRLCFDPVMRRAEVDAMRAVWTGDIQLATKALNTIEDRALQLKREHAA